MRFQELSIKRQLLIFCGLLILVPAITGAIFGYISLRYSLLDATEDRLINIAGDWNVLAKGYIDQEERVLRREEVLVEQRLRTVNTSSEQILHHFLDEKRPIANAFDDISEITIGRSGNVSILSPSGTYLLSKGRARDGKDIRNFGTNEDVGKILDAMAQLKNLNPGSLVQLKYNWREDGDSLTRPLLGTISYFAQGNFFILAVSYYTDFQSLELRKILQDELRDKMAARKINANGYIFVLDSEGRYILSKDKYQDGESVIKDASGKVNDAIQEIIKKAVELPMGALGEIRYQWRDLGESEYSNRLATFTYLPQWDWIIVSSVYESDVLSDLNHTALVAIAILFALASFGLFVAYRIAIYITKPIGQLEQVSLKLESGSLDVRVGGDLLVSRNEIGSLARALNTMILKLTEKISALDEAKRGVEAVVQIRTAELKEEHARFIASISGLSIGFAIIAEPSGKIIFKNKSFVNMLGFPEMEVSVAPVADFFKPALDLAASRTTCIQERKSLEFSSVNIGSKFFRVILTPIILTPEGGQSGAIGYVLLVEDVTEARILDRSKEEFFAVASHELRTPLTAIRGNMSLAKDLAADELKKNKDLREMVDDVYTASVRLIGIVNDFLDVSRLEQGRFAFKKEKFDMSEMLKASSHELSELAKEKSLRLDIDSDGECEVLADKERVRQVLANLIGNSIHYTREGGIKIALSKTASEARVTITDTGVGIAPQNQELLFRKFQNAGTEVLSRDVTKGTGLGLYISRLMLDAMGGKVWLERSELGEGSTFIFTLPLASSVEKLHMLK